MEIFTQVFLAALLLAMGIQLYLDYRQIRHVRMHRDTVPEAFAERITPELHRKGADYTTARTRLSAAENLYGAGLLLIWTLGGGLSWLNGFWQQWELGPLVTGTGFLVSLFLLFSVLDLPFTLYRTFGIEKRFGFNRSTPGLFLSDRLKQALIALALGIPLAALVLWLMDAGRNPVAADYGNEGWWLYVWAVWMGFNLLMLWAFPSIIAPLFNKFTPLEDRELVQRIESLLERCGFESKGIFVMDGSRRSSHGNAYFSGVGNSKRIVFFDTLLETLNGEEIEAVLAHELGHFRRRHVAKRLGTVALLSLAGLAALGYLMGQPWFYSGLGLTEPSVHGALALFLLVAPVFTFFLQPLMAAVMRRHEFEADDFASRQADAHHLVRALVKLYRDNASTLTPDPWHSAYHDSHPPAPVRIAHLSAKTG
ncbi:M48 family metallopeptidase [Thiohalomonas denitrificans]|uniref:STE24 endopeptidase n=1 Tax=Thiohalomonas denitrificans TaxID=415747 RepID=A0A1G5Q3S8_9GAMM|nr:M48 family metallopeptidase [Thiohalomonas denitrificans]SCZ56337.1 STE24 endopeptidase [Thiohalomonas denitrificans]